MDFGKFNEAKEFYFSMVKILSLIETFSLQYQIITPFNLNLFQTEFPSILYLSLHLNQELKMEIEFFLKFILCLYYLYQYFFLNFIFRIIIILNFIYNLNWGNYFNFYYKISY